MSLIPGGDFRELAARITGAAQPEPADGGVEVMRIGRGERFHAGNYNGAGRKAPIKKSGHRESNKAGNRTVGGL